MNHLTAFTALTAGAEAENKQGVHPSAEAMAAAEHADAAREIAPAQQVG